LDNFDRLRLWHCLQLRAVVVQFDVYLIPAERENFKPNLEFLDQTFSIFYQNGEITIYKVPDGTALN